MSMRMLAWLLITLISFIASGKVIHEERSLYRNILIADEDGKRCMRFMVRQRTTHNQSCRYLHDSNKLVFDYTKMILSSVMMKSDAKKILIVGLGGGTLPLSYTQLLPDAEITSLEIDPAVAKAAQRFFDYRDNDKLKTEIEDARIWIKRAGRRQQKFDLIVLDAFNGDYIPEHLLTREFLQETRQVLADKGLIVANTFSSSELYHAESVTYQAVFKQVLMLKSSMGNRVLFVSEHPFLWPDIAVQEQWREKLRPFDVEPKIIFSLIRDPDWKRDARVLTDQFSPANLLQQ